MESGTIQKKSSKIQTDSILYNFLQEYNASKTPLSISFREIIKNFSNTERASHSIHHYPAKLLVHIPFFFLSNTILSKPGDIVLDPFCGSGTVLLEAILSGRNAVGFDDLAEFQSFFI